jgi:hypothetical protein
MTAPGRPRNRTYVRLRTDVVTKPDGRYLIYYSWPDDTPAGGETASNRSQPEPPQQAPWSPETGPADV